MTFDYALRYISQGNCVLFTGSGFSLDGKCQLKDDAGEFRKFLSVKDFIAELNKLTGKKTLDGWSLAKVAQYCQKYIAEGVLIDFLLKAFTLTEMTDIHEKISQLPWRRIYTTNYDEIVETARKRGGLQSTTLTFSSETRRSNRLEGACIHINGAISKLTSETLNGEFRLTNRSYRSSQLDNSPWLQTLRDDLRNADAVFFIGFSAEHDLELQQEFTAYKELREKSFFIVRPGADETEYFGLEDFGEVLPIGASGFIQRYDEEMKSAVAFPESSTTRRNRCFIAVQTAKGAPTPPSSKEFDALIARGEINGGLLEYSLRDSARFPYFVFRKKIDEITTRLEEQPGTFLITSDLGNGKSLMLNGLAYKLAGHQELRPFMFSGDTKNVQDEVTDICAEHQRPVLLIDDYTSSLSGLRKTLEELPPNCSVVFTERYSKYDLFPERLTNLGLNPKVFFIDELTDDEISQLSRLFERYGIWGLKATDTEAQKKLYLKVSCKGEFSKIILDRIENATQLHNAFAGIVKSLTSKVNYYHLIIFILYARLIGVKIDYQLLVLTDPSESFSDVAFRNDAGIRELINFDKDVITFTSSILARYILKNHIAPQELADHLIEVFRNIDQKYRSNRDARHVLGKLILYRNLQKVFESNGLIFRIYQSLTSSYCAEDDPQFWLQYAIAATADEDFPNAGRFFNTAYALARRRTELYGKYNTYKIDNHFAHYLLTKALDKPEEVTNPYEIFLDAHKRINVAKKGFETYYYRFKVAADYPKFYRTFAGKMESARQFEGMRSAFREMANQAEEYLRLSNNYEYSSVDELLTELNEILNPQR